jgi:hypothetical protein
MPKYTSNVEKPGNQVARGRITRFNIIKVYELHRVTTYTKQVGKWIRVREVH